MLLFHADIQSIPDVPHRGSLLRFCESDNLALEREFRWGGPVYAAFIITKHLMKYKIENLQSFSLQNLNVSEIY